MLSALLFISILLYLGSFHLSQYVMWAPCSAVLFFWVCLFHELSDARKPATASSRDTPLLEISHSCFLLPVCDSAVVKSIADKWLDTMSSLQIGRTCRQTADHVCALRMLEEMELWSKNVQVVAHPSVTCLWWGRSAKPSLDSHPNTKDLSCYGELVGVIFLGEERRNYMNGIFLYLLSAGDWTKTGGS